MEPNNKPWSASEPSNQPTGPYNPQPVPVEPSRPIAPINSEPNQSTSNEVPLTTLTPYDAAHYVPSVDGMVDSLPALEPLQPVVPDLQQTPQQAAPA